MYAEKEITENQYLLLTPGPLSTSKSVRTAMLRDWCTWDADYNKLTQHIRKRLTNLATTEKGYTTILMQGSGSFSVEATLGSCVPAHGRLLILVNGAYGKRMVTIAEKINLDHLALDFGEKDPIDPETLEKCLLLNPEITHVAMVHCETTTGMLNDVEGISSLVKSYDKVFILDAMSSFGGMTMDMDVLGIDFLISSANKCIQGVPGFGFVIANESLLKACAGIARSHALDLYDQWKAMEDHQGKWRFTSPTHVVKAFSQALEELREEGGVEARNHRYRTNQHTLRDGMEKLGFKCLLPEKLQSPIITSFLYPDSPDFHFDVFYSLLKQKGFVIYPGKITSADTFRIGNIGEVYPEDINRLLGAVADSVFW